MRVDDLPKFLHENKTIELTRDRGIGFYFEALIITAGLLITAALVVDLLQIHIYAHDSIYYVTSYIHKLKHEGRWLNYLLFPFSSHVPGWLAVFSDLLFLLLFFFTVSRRWTGKVSYSLLLSLLLIQCAPLMEMLRWPATGIAAPPILFLAAIVSPYISVYLFYILFGVLLYGTSSFYLLPLAHLHLLKDYQFGQNIRTLSFRIVPGWGLGFFAGFIFSILMVYLLTGQVGIHVQEWRRPSYIDSLDDLISNMGTSFNFLQLYLAELLGGFWRKILLASAFLIGFYATKKREYIPAAILAFAVITVHFILVIPAGMYVSFRTSFAAWVGVLVIFFFYPNLKERQHFLLLPIILLLMMSFYRANHQSLTWYSSVTNTYYDELVRVSPLPPRLYRGLVFLSSSAEVEQMNDFLVRKLHLEKGKMEPLDTNLNWAPVAYEAGFNAVILCNKDRPEFYPACKTKYGDYEPYQSTNRKHSGLYKVYGEKNGVLIIGLNTGLELAELE